MNKKNYIIPVFVPHFGCPNDCIFCNQRKITNQEKSISEKSLSDYIEKYFSYIPKTAKNKEVAFYGGSFTGLPFSVMENYLKIANEFIQNGEINSIRLSTRPDYINESILKTLKKYNVSTIELGVQSLDETVLELNNRGHGVSEVIEASKLIKSQNFNLGLQMMLGLYGSKLTEEISTAKSFVSLKCDFVRIYPTLVIRDTYLEYLFKNGKYKPLTLQESIEITKKLYVIFTYNKIPVIRMGLQATDNINISGDVIAGPFHAAFGQLVKESLYFDFMDKVLEKIKLEKTLIISANKSLISYISGNKALNKKRLEKKYNIKMKIISQDIDVENIFFKTDNDEFKFSFFDYITELYENTAVVK